MPIIIKRYRNRKLYNTNTKKYINLDEIEELIKNKQEIKVIDNLTGKDITTLILSQVIFEIEKNTSGFLPIKVLISLVQSGGKRIDDIRHELFAALNLFHHYDVEIERRINLLIESGDVDEEQGNTILEKLIAIGFPRYAAMPDEGIGGKGIHIERLLPTQTEFQALIQKVDEMSQRVDEYSNSDQVQR